MLKRLQSILSINNQQRSNKDNACSIENMAQMYSQESMNKTSSTLCTVSSNSRYQIAKDMQLDQHVQSGIQHHELGQLEKATHCFRLASKEGCPIGMFLYGISLRHGWGCRVNTALAFQYLQTAAEHAVHDLLHGNEYELASKGELIMAIYELGVSFQQGWGVTKNKETAFYYFEIAANLGDCDAMNDIAFCYTHGHGVKKNIYKAAQYYRMAARQGQSQVGNSWIWKEKYNIVEESGWDADNS